MRVLLIEDYAPLRKSITQGLQEAGFAVDAASEGEEGLWYAESNDYDVVLLDLMLPNIDGLTILRRIREQDNPAHVLVLTARDTVADRVEGLNLGADDYLVKPFAFEELLARVRALVRRKYTTKSPLIRVGDLEINTTAKLVARAGQPIDLTGHEYSILELLALRLNEVVTRSMIWEHVYDFAADANSNVIDVYISNLRKKLETDNRPRLLHTRRGLGYILREPKS